MGKHYSKVFRSNLIKKKQADQEHIEPVPVNKLVIEGWKDHHDLVKGYWGENFISPIHGWLKTGGSKVLDIGCGTGTWLNEVALEYPLTEFVGVDALSLFPKNYPSNIEFVQADVKSTLPFPNDTFDYVHMRHMILCFTSQEWSNLVIPELVRVLKPGGYLELTESDMEWGNVSPTTKSLISSVHILMRQRGIDPFMVNRLYDILENTEKFETIYHKAQEAQIGKWANSNGKKLLRTCLNSFDRTRTIQCKTLQITNSEFDGLLYQFKDDVEVYKTYCKTHKFYAAKKFT